MRHNQGFIALVDEAKKQIDETDIHEVRRWIDEDKPMVLLDVREDHEWNLQHIPTARHMGKGIIERDIELLFPDKETCIVLYCGGGYRSALAAVALQQMGYRNVINMDGGIRAWQDSGYPLEQ